MRYRQLAMKLSDKYWDESNDHKVWKTVKKLRAKSHAKTFPNHQPSDSYGDMLLRLG